MFGNPPTHVARGAPRDADIRPAGMVSGGRRAHARSAALAAAAGMWLASGAAVAGDFYLRGGIGLDRPGNTAFTDVDCSTTAPAALYGCGTGGDGARLRSRGSFGPVPAFEFGLGHAGATPARFEFLVEYRPRLAFEGRANFLTPERRQEVRAELVVRLGNAGRIRRFGRIGTVGSRFPGTVRRRGHRRRAYTDREDDDDLSGDDDDHAGRKPDGTGLEGVQ